MRLETGYALTLVDPLYVSNSQKICSLRASTSASSARTRRADWVSRPTNGIDGSNDDFAEVLLRKALLRQLLAEAVEEGRLKIIGFDAQGRRGSIAAARPSRHLRRWLSPPGRRAPQRQDAHPRAEHL